MTSVKKQIRIHWQFSFNKARTKLNRHKWKVNEANFKFSPQVFSFSIPLYRDGLYDLLHNYPPRTTFTKKRFSTSLARVLGFRNISESIETLKSGISFILVTLPPAALSSLRPVSSV